MFLKVVRRRSTQSDCLYYMPRGVSNTLNHMHVALSYYIETTELHHKALYTFFHFALNDPVVVDTRADLAKVRNDYLKPSDMVHKLRFLFIE